MRVDQAHVGTYIWIIATNTKVEYTHVDINTHNRLKYELTRRA
jgi:hypothetical protein